MNKIEIYTRDGCGFCFRAKKFLDKKQLTYQEYNIWDDEAHYHAMLKRSNGARTVPQIFVNDTHIGGCDEMLTLDSQGRFDALLNVG
ncbi:MAG: glutaredoxin 3 [Alphaproteobacteria bacterium]|nr:glutaredoxin 3 [Alphaproteobacteria bacterium]